MYVKGGEKEEKKGIPKQRWKRRNELGLYRWIHPILNPIVIRGDIEI